MSHRIEIDPTPGERKDADSFKLYSLQEASKFDKLFDIGALTGYQDHAITLWKAYFASYWAAEEFQIQDISRGFIDAASNIPIIGKMWRVARSFDNSGDIAWGELKDRAQRIRNKYQIWFDEQSINPQFIQMSANTLCQIYRQRGRQPHNETLNEMRQAAAKFSIAPSGNLYIHETGTSKE